MPDPRISKLAQVLIHYSLKLQPHQQLLIRTSPLADELTLAAYEEAIKTGAHVMVQNSVPDLESRFYRFASDSQLEYISPVQKMITETFDAFLNIRAIHNSRALAGIDPKRMARARKASASIGKRFMQRAAEGSLRWALTVFPTQASAQDADMSLDDYRDFVYGAGMLDEDDPIAFWQQEKAHQEKLIAWLNGHQQARLRGSNVDLTLSIAGRRFVTAAGEYNFPDGEIFTGPVEDSANGWIRFKYPAIYSGQEITDIELWFENGRVVKERASKNQDLLTALLNTDQGARYLGEWGIGTNYRINRFTKNMLFDEKIGGTIHLAVGASYPETGGRNVSGLHWDMLCDMNDAEIIVDHTVFYKNGHPVIV